MENITATIWEPYEPAELKLEREIEPYLRFIKLRSFQLIKEETSKKINMAAARRAMLETCETNEIINYTSENWEWGDAAPVILIAAGLDPVVFGYGSSQENLLVTKILGEEFTFIEKFRIIHQAKKLGLEPSYAEGFEQEANIIIQETMDIMMFDVKKAQDDAELEILDKIANSAKKYLKRRKRG